MSSSFLQKLVFAPSLVFLIFSFSSHATELKQHSCSEFLDTYKYILNTAIQQGAIDVQDLRQVTNIFHLPEKGGVAFGQIQEALLVLEQLVVQQFSKEETTQVFSAILREMVLVLENIKSEFDQEKKLRATLPDVPSLVSVFSFNTGVLDLGLSADGSEVMASSYLQTNLWCKNRSFRFGTGKKVGAAVIDFNTGQAVLSYCTSASVGGQGCGNAELIHLPTKSHKLLVNGSDDLNRSFLQVAIGPGGISFGATNEGVYVFLEEKLQKHIKVSTERNLRKFISSRDGKYILTMRDDMKTSTIEVFYVPTGERISVQEISGSLGWDHSFDFSQDGRWYATSLPNQKAIIVSDLSGTLKEIPTEEAVSELYISPNGKWLAVIFSGEKGALLSTETWQKKTDFEVVSKSFFPIAFSFSADSTFFTYGDGEFVYLRNIETGEETQFPHEHLPNRALGDPLKIALSSTGTHLVTAAGDKKVKLWRIGKSIKTK